MPKIDLPMPRHCFTIPEFCLAHRIGLSSYYKLRDEGRGPTEIRIYSKVLITQEAAARWRAERDAESEDEEGQAEAGKPSC